MTLSVPLARGHERQVVAARLPETTHGRIGMRHLPRSLFLLAAIFVAGCMTTACGNSGSGSGSSLIWLWLLLGAVVLIGVIAAIARGRTRHSVSAADWRSRVIDAYAKGVALYDAMSVADTPEALGADDAGARWADIQRRADDLAQTLYALHEAAPDDGSRAHAADALALLQAVRSAMEAERAPGGADPGQAEVARHRLFFFEASLRALRNSGHQAP